MLSGGQDCDDTNPALKLLDSDNDGAHTCGGDCDDADPTRFPGATDLCGDGVDQDCDGGLASESDDDGDGSPECGGDCDDTDPALNPDDADGDGASTCAGDCDDGSVLANITDADTDGYSTCAGDCGDLDPSVNPGAVELCNLIDDNCDGTLLLSEADDDGDGDPACDDCDDDDPARTSLDSDGDGFDTCTGGDCDDSLLAFNPVALDGFGDGHDTNCDGIDGIDADGDGFASQASGGPDCDDATSAVNPDAVEVALDGIDQDCDGLDAADDDGDGYASILTGGDDCDDADPAVYPGFFEDPADGADDNCDGADGNAYFAFAGAGAGHDGVGWRPRGVATCDVDGDGFQDLAIAAPFAPDATGTGQPAGLVGIWHGPLTGGGTLSSAPTRLRGVAGDWVGAALTCLGDTDGDGREELAVASPRGSTDIGGTTIHGFVFVFSGDFTGELLLDPAVASPHYARIYDSVVAGSGCMLDSGDFDGDGVQDLLVADVQLEAGPSYPGLNSNPLFGQARILPGPFPDLTDIAVNSVALIDDVTYLGVADLRGFRSVGDTNGDGFDDVVMSSPDADLDPGPAREGRVHLFLGPLLGSLTPDSAQARIGGGALNSAAGHSVEGTDLDGDGYSDLIITTIDAYGVGAPQFAETGGVYIFFGPITGELELEFADAVLVASPGDQWILPSVAAAGDVNGDGFGDLLVTADSINGSGANRYGDAGVVFGPFGGQAEAWGATHQPLSDEIEATTSQSIDYSALATRAADLDGDGDPDPIILRTLRYDSDHPTSVRVFVNPYDF